MKRIFYFLLLFAMMNLISSCEDVVQVKLDEGSKIIVIDAFVNDKPETQTVIVRENDTYFSNREAPPVSTAEVVLKDLTANKQYTFTYKSGGRYEYDGSSQPAIAGINHLFELNVKIGSDTYTSLSTQKRTAVIDSISAIYNDGSGGFGPTEPYYLCFLWARDKVDQTADYYWIKTYRNDTLFAEPGDLNVCIDGTGGPVYDSSADTLDFTPPAVYLGFNSYKKGDQCKVEVHSVSRECYNFLIQAVTQIQNGGLFATTPENVRTNISTPEGAVTKAIGWFNMAGVASKVKQVK